VYSFRALLIWIFLLVVASGASISGLGEGLYATGSGGKADASRRTGLTKRTLGAAQVLAKGSLVPNSGFMMVKGVVDFPDQIMDGAKVYAEVPVPNMIVTLDRFAIYDPANISALAALPANLTDTYQPCVLHPDLAPSAVYEVSLPPNTTSDTLSVELCSPGGYDQVGPLPQLASAPGCPAPTRVTMTLPAFGDSRGPAPCWGRAGPREQILYASASRDWRPSVRRDVGRLGGMALWWRPSSWTRQKSDWTTSQSWSGSGKPLRTRKEGRRGVVADLEQQQHQ
jgi:hypothetical protein